MWIVSIIALSLCSYSSPLFWDNISPDSNTYMDVARAMLYGHKVLYSQIFDQKGIYLYFLNIISLIISHKSFIGIYIFEIIGLFLSMYFTYKISLLVTKHKLKISLLSGLSVMLLALIHPYYDYGGSCESLLFPVVIYLIYKIVQHDYLGHSKIPFTLNYKEWIIQGILVGIIFLTKYTILGSWIAFYLAISIIYIKYHAIHHIVRMIYYSFFGFILSTFPWLIYSIITSSFDSFLHVYIYDNIVLYTKENGFPPNVLAKLLASFTNISELYINSNIILLILFLLTCWSLIKKNRFLQFKRSKYLYTFMFLIGSMLGIFGFTIGNVYQYYELILFPYMLPGLITVIQTIFTKYIHINKGNHIKIFSISIIALLFFLMGLNNNISSSRLFPNNPSITLNQQSKKKEKPYQLDFGKYIDNHCNPKKSSLLEYGCISLGVYNAANITPNTYYFQDYNLSENTFPNAIDAQKRDIKEGLTKWVVLTTPVYTNIQHWAGNPLSRDKKILPGNLNTGTIGKFNENLFKNYNIKKTRTFSFEAQNQRAYLLERRKQPLTRNQLQRYLQRNSYKYMNMSEEDRLINQMFNRYHLEGIQP